MTDTIRLLKGIPIFAGLSNEELEKISSLCTQKDYEKGSIVVKEGDLARELYIVKEGAVEIVKGAGSSDEHSLARLWEGDCFGEMALIDIQPRSASVRTTRDSVIFALSNRDFLKLYQWKLHTYTMIVLNIAKEISRRLRKADSAIAEHVSKGREEGRPDPDTIDEA